MSQREETSGVEVQRQPWRWPCETARMEGQPRRPSTDECIKKMWCMHTVEYYSAIKEPESVVGRQMDLEPAIPSEVTRREKKNTVY